MAIKAGVTQIEAVDIPSTAASLFTVGTAIKRILISQASISNYSSSVIDGVTIWIVPPLGSNDDRYKVVINRDLGVGQTLPLGELLGREIVQGGSIWAQSTTASAVSLTVTASEFDS